MYKETFDKILRIAENYAYIIIGILLIFTAGTIIR